MKEKEQPKKKYWVLTLSFWNNLVGFIAGLLTIFLFILTYKQSKVIEEQVRLIHKQNTDYLELVTASQAKKDQLRGEFNENVKGYSDKIEALQNEIENNKSLNDEQKKELKERIKSLEKERDKLKEDLKRYDEILSDTSKTNLVSDSTCQIALARMTVQYKELQSEIFESKIKNELKIDFRTIKVEFPNNNDAKICFTYDNKSLEEWANKYKGYDDSFIMKIKVLSYNKNDNSEQLINYKKGSELSKDYQEQIKTFFKLNKVDIIFINDDGYFGKPFIGNRYFLFNIQIIAKKSSKIIKEFEFYGNVKNHQLVLPSGNIY